MFRDPPPPESPLAERRDFRAQHPETGAQVQIPALPLPAGDLGQVCSNLLTCKIRRPEHLPHGVVLSIDYYSYLQRAM